MQMHLSSQPSQSNLLGTSSHSPNGGELTGRGVTRSQSETICIADKVEISWDCLQALAFHAPLYKARGQNRKVLRHDLSISQAAAWTVGDESWGRVYQAISVLSRLCQHQEFSSASFPYSFQRLYCESGPPAWRWAHSFGERTRANSVAQEGWTCEMWRLNCAYWPCTTWLARSFHVCTYQPALSRFWLAVI